MLATKVLRSTNVTATFDDGMDASTLDDPDTRAGVSDFTLEKVTRKGNIAVAATVSYGAAAKKATLTPTQDLLGAGATYRATVATEAKDKAGNALAHAKVWQFKTGSK